MSAATFVLDRREDPSGVSGTGIVCEGVEFSDGAVAVRWPGDHPSTAAWGDIRDMEAIHGHNGKTVVTYTSSERLLAAYQRVMPYLVSEFRRPLSVQPHPDHPDRLRLVFLSEPNWRFWLALLDGSTDTATHQEVDGEMRHTWISPEGDLWLIFHTPLVESHPLEIFDREDR